MTGKRSNRSSNAANPKMQDWLASGARSIEMFHDAVPPQSENAPLNSVQSEGADSPKLGDPPPEMTEGAEEASETSGAPPRQTDGEREADHGAPKPVELRLISNRVTTCDAAVDAKHLRLLGPFKDSFVAKATEIAVALKDLGAGILGLQPDRVGSTNILDVELKGKESRVASGVRLAFPDEVREQVASMPFQKSMHAFLQLLDEGKRKSAECEALMRDCLAPERVVQAARNLRSAIGGSDLRDGLTLACPSWKEQLALPKVIAEAEAQPKTKVKGKSKGAFRGYFIDDRVAYFVEHEGRRTKLVIKFDEKKYLAIVRLLSRAEFIGCCVSYDEHHVGNRIDSLEMTGISQVQGDLYQTDAEFNAEVQALLAKLNAPVE